MLEEVIPGNTTEWVSPQKLHELHTVQDQLQETASVKNVEGAWKSGGLTSQ